MKSLFLSYELSEELSGYGGGDRIQIEKVRQMCCGDTSNNTTFAMPTHFGTHLDFPFHFSDEGRVGSTYQASDFIFEDIELVELDMRGREECLVCADDLQSAKNPEAKVLILKTFFCEERAKDLYWENGPGFKPEAAARLKELWPNLKMIGFDSISLTNFQNRPLGRVAHKAFLMEHDILILEDMDLRSVGAETKFQKLIVAPLRMSQSDGAPATVIAEIE